MWYVNKYKELRFKRSSSLGKDSTKTETSFAKFYCTNNVKLNDTQNGFINNSLKEVVVESEVTATGVGLMSEDLDFDNVLDMLNNFDDTTSNEFKGEYHQPTTPNVSIQNLVSEFSVRIADHYTESLSELNSKVNQRDILVAELTSELAIKTRILDDMTQKYQALLEKQARIAKALSDDAF